MWSSPMRRAVETTEPIVKMAGLRLVTDSRVRERTNWDNPSHESVDQFLENWQRASADREYVPRSGDSSHLAATYDHGVAAVVAHGGITMDACGTCSATSS